MAQNRESKGTRLTGINPLAYMGVEPSSPPQLVVYQNSPTNRDLNYNLGTLWVVETPFEVWMLINKTPQNATKWILIYPQGDAGEATLFPTDNGTAQADAITHELNVLGGDNINTAAPGNINNVVVNLNEFITWPSTNDAGDQGVIYLGGERFFHNFGNLGVGDNNTFLGTESGNFTLTGTTNTGIGAHTLENVTTGLGNTAIGAGTLANITTGQDNIALGDGAGQALTANDTGNIAIGNDGVIGDQNVIRLGLEGFHTTAHVAGINGVTVAGTVTPNTLVNVDDQGQLGQVLLTSSGATVAITQPSNGVINLEAVGGGGGGGGNPIAFSYVQVTDTANRANNSTYHLGSEVALTQLFDVGGTVFPGDGAGAPAVFTAPVTGKYYLEWYCGLDNFINSTITIITTKRNYQQTNQASSQAPVFNLYTVVADMDMGDTAVFDIRTLYPVLSPTRVRGNAPNALDNSTRISGFLISDSAGGGGGTFSQPFLGIMEADATTGVVGATYFLGSGFGAPMVEQYDIGNNFNPGDGAGTPASFTAPATGIYSFTIAVRNGAGSNFSILLYKNAVLMYGRNPEGAIGTSTSQIVEFNLNLTITDVITFAVNSNPFPTTISFEANLGFGVSVPRQTFVSGFRIA